MFKEKLSMIALIVVCRLFSADKNVHYRLSPIISEELAQSFNGQKVIRLAKKTSYLIGYKEPQQFQNKLINF